MQREGVGEMSNNGKIKWKYRMHINGTEYHSVLYRSEYMGRGVQCEIHTPVIGFGQYGRAKRSFFIDGDEREFESEEVLRQAIESEVVSR